MTIAEKAAKAWVEHLFQMLVIEKNNSGPNFDSETFRVESLINVHLFTCYKTGIVPENSRKKALKLARKLWNGKLEKYRQESRE